jgi:hypothetical protein
MATLSIAAAATAPSPSESVGEAFVRALASDDLATVRALATPGSDMGAPVNVLEKYNCISIGRYEVTVKRRSESAATLTVFIDVTGVTSGAVHRQLPLPVRWGVELAVVDGVWRIRSAVPADTLLVLQLMSASDAERSCFLESRRDLDLVQIARQLAYTAASWEYAADDKGAMAFATRLADSLEDPPTALCVPEMAALLEAYRGHTDRSIEIANDCVRTARNLGDTDEIASALSRLASMSWMGGRIEDASQQWAESAAFVDSLADPRTSLRALYMYSSLELDQGQPREAFDAAERLRELSVK